MAKILITGASGFVGSFLVEEALSRGLDTYAGIRSSSSKKWLQDERIHFLELNLSDQNSLEAICEKYEFDYVIHNAGITKSNRKSDFFRVNVDFSRNMALGSLKSSGLKKFGFMSSLAAFGPADFQQDKVVGNDSKPHPVTTYGHSKLRAERVLREMEDLSLLIFRPTGVFGPRETDFLNVFQTIQKGLSPTVGFSSQHISLIYVKDLARVVLDAMLSDVCHRSYFISDGNLYTTQKFNTLIAASLDKKPIKIKIPTGLMYLIAGISETMAKITGKASILNMDKFAEIKARNLDCDISPLVRDFHFQPKYSLEEAVQETAEWYREQGWI